MKPALQKNPVTINQINIREGFTRGSLSDKLHHSVVVSLWFSDSRIINLPLNDKTRDRNQHKCSGLREIGAKFGSVGYDVSINQILRVLNASALHFQPSTIISI